MVNYLPRCTKRPRILTRLKQETEWAPTQNSTRSTPVTLYMGDTTAPALRPLSVFPGHYSRTGTVEKDQTLSILWNVKHFAGHFACEWPLFYCPA